MAFDSHGEKEPKPTVAGDDIITVIVWIVFLVWGVPILFIIVL